MDKDVEELPTRRISINSSLGIYSVEVLKETRIPRADLVIVDETVLGLHPGLAGPDTVGLKLSEINKNLETVGQILGNFQDHGLNKNSLVAFVGGGVLQDVATLASSLYMRGIRWTYYPTTLQSMLDSCVGGKSSINFGNQKNALGNFYPPVEIAICTDFLTTLSTDHLVSGLMEGLKISIAAGKERDFKRMCSDLVVSNILELPFSELISFTLQQKKVFVEQDEFDRGIRRKLNFGHTFGHAIESGSGFQVAHGVAIGIGMLAAFNLSRKLGLLTAINETPEGLIVKLFKYLDLDRAIIPIDFDTDRCIESLRFDKKTIEHNYVFILPSESGLQEVPLAISIGNKKLILESIDAAIEMIS